MDWGEEEEEGRQEEEEEYEMGEERIVGEIESDGQIKRVRFDSKEDSISYPNSKRMKKNGEKEEEQKKVEGKNWGSLLVQSIRSGILDNLRKLIEEEGAGVNEKTCGSTPLMYAAFYGKEDFINYLIEKNADLNYQNLNGLSAIHWAVERNHISIVRCLVVHGVNVNLTDLKGLTGNQN
eukprot:TRINITY_DN3513_c0_g1_i2.p1 TRINITY_DN3513_c0_g1~~TRINITY_DN3513_c0_g1_i2.p1  ORF type:complete len:179 (-),score=85.65 TRINITY_DN3513_c0_g1_i2:591-1127(-)